MTSPSNEDSTASDDDHNLLPRRLSRAPVDRRRFLKGTAAGVLFGSLVGPGCMLEPGGSEPGFRSRWPADVERHWLGPAYWTNPLQDWRLSNGRVELIKSGTDRTVVHLTRQIRPDGEPFELDTNLGFVSEATCRGGFEVGMQGPLEEYRNNAIHGSGLRAGLSTNGRLSIGDSESSLDQEPGEEGAHLQLSATPTSDGYSLVLTAYDAATDETLGQVERHGVTPSSLEGNLSLFADAEDGESDGNWGDPRLWFRQWEGAGGALAVHEDRAFGPVLFAQHTLSRGTLKMTAQLPPLGSAYDAPVSLEVQRDGVWETVAEADVHDRARTVTLRVDGWDETEDVPYRLACDYEMADGVRRQHYTGAIRKDPVDQDEIVVGGFSCATHAGFPHSEVAAGAMHHDPDLVAFTGDQYYEHTGGYGVERQRENVELATLDVLRKWIMHGWAFGELMRDRPSICLLDDHDVYHGNIWGEGGKQVDRWELHDNGGYFMPPEWVNAVQRMQTSHLPDPYDPTPIKNDISVYYTDMVYGRVSFAMLEDRKWKTGPDGFLPANPGRPDWIEDPDFDPSTVDLEEATLLGDRQLSFLEDWAADWRGADMKAVISQTCFSQVPTHHGSDFRYLVADLDSNGWPQTPRDEALRRIRKGFAVHLGGDQHLPMLQRYGIDDWNDAPYNFCVPGISVGYVRGFWPDADGDNPRTDVPYHTGEYEDGLGNKITVRAVANPEKEFASDDPLVQLANKSSGYGILRFDKANHEITAECWPILSDPRKEDDEQYAGWPETFSTHDNDGRTAVGHLPTIEVDGVTDPMIQVVDEDADEIVYTLRIQGQTYRPKVYTEGPHTVRVGDDDEWRERRENVRPGDDSPMQISL